ncbi:hypothetical protein [Chryseobacterium herbae]|uniref:Uncharacterized protein n=1 Tax=Chryseobacterium herbae TaxID=2976476 RepID=A0ABT2ISW0_9FLAO|nr:hypothetical protein [Chryseobacterium sp. pc1-10]MCT2561923.1 hypothetical protein [Chryseobacterium sp. pc1-10]
MASAKDAEIKNPSKDNKLEIKVESKDSKLATNTNCWTYGTVIGCTNEMVTDTVCGETYAEAQECMDHNAALMNEFFCGN